MTNPHTGPATASSAKNTSGSASSEISVTRGEKQAIFKHDNLFAFVFMKET